MKYTIPYDDKITLPHIKRIDHIGISANDLNYDTKELSGEVIISGEYSIDDEKDIMEFKHDIPVSFLIDDSELSPQIHISNFKYEVMPGRGLEVMFDLDVLLASENRDEILDQTLEANTQKMTEDIATKTNPDEQETKQFQNRIDESLDQALNKRSNGKATKKKTTKTKQEEVEEITIENEEPVPQTEVEAEIPIREIEEEPFNIMTNISSLNTPFDLGFVPREHDHFTTYKIILLEGEEDVNSILEQRQLSKALLCDEYQFDDKIVLKINHD